VARRANQAARDGPPYPNGARQPFSLAPGAQSPYPSPQRWLHKNSINAVFFTLFSPENTALIEKKRQNTPH
jgi:hypothetical protein